jgi:hypothetical protein
MSVEKNKAYVRHAIEALNERNWDLVNNFIGTNFIDHILFQVAARYNSTSQIEQTVK